MQLLEKYKENFDEGPSSETSKFLFFSFAFLSTEVSGLGNCRIGRFALSGDRGNCRIGRFAVSGDRGNCRRSRQLCRIGSSRQLPESENKIPWIIAATTAIFCRIV
jgi:hypothetical protein